MKFVFNPISGTLDWVASTAVDVGLTGLATSITAGKTLTLAATDNYTLTVPATGTAALLATANVFTTQQMVDGTSDQIQLRVQAHSSQTAALQTWENSSGTALTSIKFNGGLLNSITTADFTNNLIHNDFTSNLTLSNNSSNNFFQTKFTLTTGSNTYNYSGTLIATYYLCSHDRTGTVGAMIALKAETRAQSSGGISTTAAGLYAIVQNNAGGTMANAYGVYSEIKNTGAGTITNGYGFNVLTPTRSAGTIANMYGVYINNISVGGTLNYSIYTNAGLNRYGDQVAIDGSADRQQLIVTGFSTQAVATAMAQITRNDTVAGISAMLGLTALGSGANGDGGSVLLNGKTSTTAATAMGLLSWSWVDATHASRKAKLSFSAYDTAVRLGLEIEATGTVSKNTFFGGVLFPYVAKTADYTLTVGDYTVNCTANSFNITIPTAVGFTGQVYNIKNSGTGVITILTTSSQTIDDAASGSITLDQYDNLTVQSNGANWIIL